MSIYLFSLSDILHTQTLNQIQLEWRLVKYSQIRIFSCRLAWWSWYECNTKILRMCSTSPGLQKCRPRSHIFWGITFGTLAADISFSFMEVIKLYDPLHTEHISFTQW